MKNQIKNQTKKRFNYVKTKSILLIILFIVAYCSDEKAVDTGSDTTLTASISGTASAETVEPISGSLAKLSGSVALNKALSERQSAVGCANSDYEVFPVGSGKAMEFEENGEKVTKKKTGDKGTFSIDGVYIENEVVFLFTCGSAPGNFLTNNSMKCLAKPGAKNIICDPITDAVVRTIEVENGGLGIENSKALKGLKITDNVVKMAGDIKNAAKLDSNILLDIEGASDITSLASVLTIDLASVTGSTLTNIANAISLIKDSNGVFDASCLDINPTTPAALSPIVLSAVCIDYHEIDSIDAAALGPTCTESSNSWDGTSTCSAVKPYNSFCIRGCEVDMFFFKGTFYTYTADTNFDPAGGQLTNLSFTEIDAKCVNDFPGGIGKPVLCTEHEGILTAP
ncbi:MAG: hypothetical protein OEZ22_09615 [Spirochaetia bacterium]|nr:hypothetical protein [Spirochaetia bacterium]